MRSWCDEVNDHLDAKLEVKSEKDVDILEQIKQLDKLIAKQREMIIRSRSQFEDEFYGIKDLIDQKCLELIDQKLTVFHEVRRQRQDKSSALYHSPEYSSGEKFRAGGEEKAARLRCPRSQTEAQLPESRTEREVRSNPIKYNRLILINWIPDS